MEDIIILLLLKTVLIVLLINEGRHGWISLWTPPTCTVDQSSWNILQNIFFVFHERKKEIAMKDRSILNVASQIQIHNAHMITKVQCVGTRQHEMAFATDSIPNLTYFQVKVGSIGNWFVKSGCCIQRPPGVVSIWMNVGKENRGLDDISQKWKSSERNSSIHLENSCKIRIMNFFPRELHAEPVLFKQRELRTNMLLQTTMSTAFESSLACSLCIKENVCKYPCFCMFPCTSSEPLTFNVT